MRGTGTETLVLGAVALGLFLAFIARQATAREPLLPLRLFRSRNVSGSNVLQLLLVAGLFGFFFLDSLYLRRVMGYSAIGTGFAFLPITVTIGAFSLSWAARLSERFGARAVVIAGTFMAALGLGIFALAPLNGGYFTTIFPAMLLLGAGMGVSFPSLMMFAMSGATASDSGLASGVINTTSQVGGSFGLAILATIAASHTHTLLRAGTNGTVALAAGYHLAFGLCAACLIVATLIAVTVLKSVETTGAGEESVLPPIFTSP
jgi:predicted MFS family arabinose efflux permease